MCLDSSCVFVLFFFFKQKTAYELRISDWSSDVCSSDLPRLADSLGAMAEVLGDRDAAVVREISKTFEETVTGRLSELSARYVDAPPKGEIVVVVAPPRSEEHTSELQSLMRISYAVFCLKKKIKTNIQSLEQEATTEPELSQ